MKQSPLYMKHKFCFVFNLVCSVSLKCDRNSSELFIAKSSTNLIGTVPFARQVSTSFCVEVTLNSYLRFLEFFRVKAFDWKIFNWTFCCTVSVSILSCLFDSRRRCDKIKGFFEYSATLHFKTFHDLLRVNLHFFERHDQSQKLFPQSLLF